MKYTGTIDDFFQNILAYRADTITYTRTPLITWLYSIWRTDRGFRIEKSIRRDELIVDCLPDILGYAVTPEDVFTLLKMSDYVRKYTLWTIITPF